MHIDLPLYLWFFTLGMASVPSVDTTSTVSPVITKWVLDGRMKNSITDLGLIRQYGNVSKRECAIECTKAQSCIAFYYTKHIGRCRLHTNRFAKGTSPKNILLSQDTVCFTLAAGCDTNHFVYDSTMDKYLDVKSVAKMTKFQAQKACEHKGATLARLKSLGDVEAVKNLFQTQILNVGASVSQWGNPIEGLWLDAEFSQDTGKLTWTDGTDVDVNIPSMWEGGIPTFEGNSFCLAFLLPKKVYYKLKMIPCTSSQPVMLPLCECIP